MQEQAEQTNFEEFIRIVVRKKPQLQAKQKYPDGQVVINQNYSYCLQDAKTMSCFYKVINALTEQKPNFVPYRDSKLPLILQHGLGGDFRALMILNLGNPYLNFQLKITYFLQKDPQQDHQDLLFQLKFGQRVQEIRNKIDSVKNNDIL